MHDQILESVLQDLTLSVVLVACKLLLGCLSILLPVFECHKASLLRVYFSVFQVGDVATHELSVDFISLQLLKGIPNFLVFLPDLEIVDHLSFSSLIEVELADAQNNLGLKLSSIVVIDLEHDVSFSLHRLFLVSQTVQR